jgi:hypothetical protein
MASASARPSGIRFVALGAAVGLSVVEAAGVIVNNAAHGGAQDWRVFVNAGARAGTPALLHPVNPTDVFAYTPGFAWLLLPFAHVPRDAGFWIDVVLMLVCAIAAALIAARTDGLGRTAALVLALGWTPVLNAVAVGQNATLGLLLAVVTIAGFVRGSTLMTAVPLGLLLYKPTYALPLFAVLAVRGRLRAFALAALGGVLWYVASVAATGGDWRWPFDWTAMVAHYGSADFAYNAVKATSLPALLVRVGMPLWLIALAVAAAFGAVLLALRRVDLIEAGSAACIAGLALSPHAWPYDAALAYPMIALAWVRLPPRLQTPAAVVFAVAGPAFLFSSIFGFNPQALVVVGGTIAWLIVRMRRPAEPATVRQTPRER